MDSSENFEYFSREYSEALQAYEAIEKQASTLMVMGYSDDLRNFIEQFVEMAARAKKLAQEKGEAHFAEWFGELVEKAEALKSGATP